MQRLSLLLIAGAMLAVAAPANAAQQRRYAAPVVACHQGLTPDQRYLDVRATMQAVRGTVRMAVRFDLSERTPATAGLFQPRPAPDLGVWLKSKRGVDPYTYDQTVKGLEAPASYKMRVGFRWYARHNHLIKSAHRWTPVCAQPDLRPNLVIKNVFVSLDRRHYTVVVRNNGATAAGPFNVGFTPAGGPAQTLPIAGLAPADQTRVTFTGPVCDPAAPPAFSADASNQVDESNETDNGATATC
jgi:CARDB